MTKKNKIYKITITAVLLIGFLTAASYGQEGGFNPVADEMIGSSGITWMPKVNYSQLGLTISRPNGTVFSKTFNSGSSPYVGLSEIFGDSYQDGSYNYELRVIPVPGERSRSAELDRFSAQTKEALVQSGAFFVRGGAIVTMDISEVELGASSPLSGAQDGLSGTKDIVHLDDVIVDGSICVGQDCVNGENFGFDTIRLKENNLRIKFQDTSNSASFPSNDWQLTANDSSNGGANKFSIDDIDGGRTPFTIEAGARTNALYVESDGDVGIGTSNPVVDVHVITGNTPTLRLEQDGSSGFTPQTWDVAGNETNFFVRDATNGSKLPFKIKPNAPTNSIYVDTDGVGFGTGSPGFPIHLVTNSGTNAAIVAERTGGATTFVNATGTQGVFGTTTDHNLRLVRNSQFQMDLIGNSDIVMQDGGGYDGTWNNASSRELKENIKDLTIDDAVEALVGLNPVTYNYKENKTEARVGFIAEDVPELVGMKSKKSIAAMDIVSVLTKVVQEQQKTISKLEERITDLEKDSK
jgi:hypothetical protein